ncbi:MAG: hypothetical protein J5725_10335 [Bacteroidales bacterium]|nr:hypothetical protein [Bacteroidales bacterium]
MELFICKSCKNNGCPYMGTDTLINPCEDYVLTNADKIRTMTDGELAEWINNSWTFGREWEGYDSLLDWLKQEVQDDGNC